ncbi:hypothetical protein GE061_000522 [Apolygus lucorum]|uniref:Uncharacterized protein n=1 Tax=Apolygus lucorum TaxID=248454 RepID=A0A8S9Y4H8_APOLU|nr:hypothetical protein GE061_000522 [Apolygus lucorum]
MMGLAAFLIIFAARLDSLVEADGHSMAEGRGMLGASMTIMMTNSSETANEFLNQSVSQDGVVKKFNVRVEIDKKIKEGKEKLEEGMKETQGALEQAGAKIVGAGDTVAQTAKKTGEDIKNEWGKIFGHSMAEGRGMLGASMTVVMTNSSETANEFLNQSVSQDGVVKKFNVRVEIDKKIKEGKEKLEEGMKETQGALEQAGAKIVGAGDTVAQTAKKTGEDIKNEWGKIFGHSMAEGRGMLGASMTIMMTNSSETANEFLDQSVSQDGVVKKFNVRVEIDKKIKEGKEKLEEGMKETQGALEQAGAKIVGAGDTVAQTAKKTGEDIKNEWGKIFGSI